MSRKIIEKEGRRWTELGIVTPEQYKQILGLYTEKKNAIGLVPILGSLLVGLGILSFTAANWQDIPQMFRLILIIASMCGFYVAGEMQLRRGHDKLGIALVGIGLITFGAGIVLIAQMFHLEAYDVTSWIIWGIAGILLTYLYTSRYLYLLSLLLFSIAQWYSVVEFHNFSYAAFGLMIVGLGYYAWKHQNSLLAWLFSLSYVIQSIMLVSVNDWQFVWVFIPILVLYTLGDFVKNRDFALPLQVAPLIAAYLFDLFIVLYAHERDYMNVKEDLLAQPLPFFAACVVLFGISMLLKVRSGRALSGVEWILMPPLLYLPIQVDVLYLFVLFFFSLFLLWRGYIEEWRFKINLGTFLFLISTMTAYFKLAWSFMDKSLFFIFGGILLLALSWFLNRRRMQFIEEKIEDNKEGIDHV